MSAKDPIVIPPDYSNNERNVHLQRTVNRYMIFHTTVPLLQLGQIKTQAYNNGYRFPALGEEDGSRAQPGFSPWSTRAVSVLHDTLHCLFHRHKHARYVDRRSAVLHPHLQRQAEETNAAGGGGEGGATCFCNTAVVAVQSALQTSGCRLLCAASFPLADSGVPHDGHVSSAFLFTTEGLLASAQQVGLLYRLPPFSPPMSGVLRPQKP